MRSWRASAAQLPCRVGGGIRTPARAQAVLALGATQGDCRLGAVHGGTVSTSRLRRSAGGRGRAERLIAAVDSRDGEVVIHGWRPRLDADRRPRPSALLEPFVGEFLYTHVDREGLMQGTDMAAIDGGPAATSRALTAAGGITTHGRDRALDALGVDAVVGMALYTGRLTLAG